MTRGNYRAQQKQVLRHQRKNHDLYGEYRRETNIELRDSKEFRQSSSASILSDKQPPAMLCNHHRHGAMDLSRCIRHSLGIDMIRSVRVKSIKFSPTTLIRHSRPGSRHSDVPTSGRTSRRAPAGSGGRPLRRCVRHRRRPTGPSRRWSTAGARWRRRSCLP